MKENFKLVQIDTQYINYLRQFDNRVCYNKEWSNIRPYIGILFKLKGYKYFAPLTLSGKGYKLKDKPKAENITFFPIKNCEYGGVNLNNMIPVIENVYSPIDLTITELISEKEKKYKLLLINQINYLNKNEKILRTKANTLYSRKVLKTLYKNYDLITCDFQKLEKIAKEYKKTR